MYRMIVSDLDGTLLNSEKQISKRNLQAVQRLEEAGVEFVAATGRSDVMTRPYLRQLPNVNIVIGCDGAVIRNIKTGEILYENVLSSKLCEKAFEICREYGLSYYVFTKDCLVGDDPANERLLIHRKFNETLPKEEQIPIEFTDCLESYAKKHQVFKIVASHDCSQYLDQVAEVIRKKTGADAVRSGKKVLAIKAAGVSKAEALKKLAKQMKLSMNEIAAFGDEVNDIDMLKAVGLGIAMGNADPKVKKAADVVADCNDLDGVGKELDRLYKAEKM